MGAMVGATVGAIGHVINRSPICLHRIMAALVSVAALPVEIDSGDTMPEGKAAPGIAPDSFQASEPVNVRGHFQGRRGYSAPPDNRP